MILVKNKLKRLKRDNEDDMLHYLKYSHLDDIPEENYIPDIRKYKSIATQFPDIKNKMTQTIKRETEDKETDTYDDLNEIIGDYILMMNSKRYDKNELMAEAHTQPIPKRERQMSSGSSSDSEGPLSRNIKRGFRLAEFAMNSAIVGANVTMAVADAIGNVADTVIDLTTGNQNNEDDEDEDEDEVVSVHSSDPVSVSSGYSPQTVLSSSASSIPMPTSPQSSKASSASSSKDKPVL